MKTKLTLALVATLAAVAAICSATPSQASPINYYVNLAVGTGSATGFIQTDGTIGTLATGNITNYDLTLTDGAHTFSLI
jgi:hypothetical protein